ncbi:MAG: MFS transporter [Steroidobacteraceae bacterium]|nr:MFS transporter [Steroidobacteraceae bacterium]
MDSSLPGSAPAPTPARERRRALLAVSLVNFAGMAGFGTLFPILPQYGLSIGASATQVGLALAAFSVGQLLAGARIGALSDRHGRRPVLLWSLVLTALFSALTAFCDTPASLIVVRLLAGLASGSFGVTFAVAADVTTPQQRATAMAQVGAGLSLGFILGPAVGGLIAGATAEPADFARVCWASALLAILAFAATLALLPETSPSRPAHAAPGAVQGGGAPRDGGGRLGTRRLLGDARVARLTAVGLLAAAAVATMEASFPLFASSAFAAGPRTIGFVFGAMGILSTVLQLAGTGPATRRFGNERVLLAGLVLQCSGLGLLGIAASFALAIAGMLLIAIGFAFLNPAISSLASLAGPAAAQGEVLGLQQSAGALGRIAGPAAGGALFDGFGGNAPFLCGALAMLATAIYAGRTVPRDGARTG